MKLIFQEERLQLKENLTLNEAFQLKEKFEVKSFKKNQDEFIYILPKGLDFSEGIYAVNNVIEG